MTTLNTKQVLSNVYGLMMEMNYHSPEEEVLMELTENPDSHLEKHLLKIRQITAKLKAQQNKERFQRVIDQIRDLREKGLDELKKLIRPQEQAQLIPLFRKFEELSSNDEAAILEDQELLLLIEILKDRINENPE